MEGFVRTGCKNSELVIERESVLFLSEGWEFFLLQKALFVQAASRGISFYDPVCERWVFRIISDSAFIKSYLSVAHRSCLDTRFEFYRLKFYISFAILCLDSHWTWARRNKNERERQKESEWVITQSMRMNWSWYIDVYGWMNRYLDGREREQRERGRLTKAVIGG